MLAPLPDRSQILSVCVSSGHPEVRNSIKCTEVFYTEVSGKICSHPRDIFHTPARLLIPP